jgi:hypothetical protein
MTRVERLVEQRGREVGSPGLRETCGRKLEPPKDTGVDYVLFHLARGRAPSSEDPSPFPLTFMMV